MKTMRMQPFGLVGIGYLSLLAGVSSVSIGGNSPSYLDYADDRKSIIRGFFPDEAESHRELQNDGNETGEQIVPSIVNITNATANTTTTNVDDEVMIYISKAIFGVTIGLGVIAVLVSILSWVFVYVHRKNSLVAIGQPPFLYLISFGSVLLSLELFFLFRYQSSTDNDGSENSLQLDGTCQVELWLRNIGTVCVHMAIFCKMWRANKVTQFRKNQIILPKHVIGPFAIMMLTVIALTITQTIVDSPEWYVANFQVVNNANSNSVTIGSCIWRHFNPKSYSTGRDEALSSNKSNYTWIDIGSWIVIFLSLVVMVYMAWSTRKIPEEISDSRRVFQAVLTGLCLSFIMLILGCIGIFFQIYELAVVAKSLNCFCTAIDYVGFLIIPKLYSIWQKQRKINQPSPEESDLKFSNVSTDRKVLNANGTRGRVYIGGLNQASHSSS